MHLTIFHYHLLPGGVTQVVTSSVVSILRFLPEIKGITLACGKDENIDNVIAAIKNKTGIRVKKAVIPEIGYYSELKGEIDPDILAEKLYGRFKNDIWWIHNFHLGKNPLFTKAVLKIARSGREIKMVLQIHDFPECSRYEYVEQLKNYIDGSLYPVQDSIRYAVINSRDRKILTAAGIPEDSVFLLDNPVEEEEPLNGNDEAYFRLDKFFADSQETYLPGKPILIYPVRTIRRKNVLEAGFLTKLLSFQANLFVTLPGISETEKTYSQTVEKAFADGLIKGVFGSGPKGEKAGFGFKEQIKASSAVISSSVQEGFGYLYVNALQWGKPLLARYLDILDGMMEVFADTGSLFYSNINVPLTEMEKEDLKKSYGMKIKSLERFLPDIAIAALEDQINTLLKKEHIDFSFLSVYRQLEFLKKAGDRGFKSTVSDMNKELIETVERMVTSREKILYSADIKRFSLREHAMTIRKILNSFDSRINMNTDSDINLKVLTTFAGIEFIRLLYDYNTEKKSQ